MHIVVLVYVFEYDMPEIYLDENGNELMSRTKAMKRSGSGRVNGLADGVYWKKFGIDGHMGRF